MQFCNKVNNLMTICHIIYKKCFFVVIFFKLIKGFAMLTLMKNAESLFERFEKTCEVLAQRIF